MEERKIRVDIVHSRSVNVNEHIFRQIFKDDYDKFIFTKYTHRDFTACIESDEQLGIYTAIMFLKYRPGNMVVPLFGTAGFKSPLQRAKSIIRMLRLINNIVIDDLSGIRNVRLAVRKTQSDRELVTRLLERHNYKKIREDEFKIIYKYERPV